jgi:mono/diheme cytochrome c family protein
LSGYLSLLAFAVVGMRCAFAAEPATLDSERVQQGRATFLEKSCSHCHGHDANTGVKLAGRDDLTPEYIFATIKNGKKSGGRLMPPWAAVLNDEEINSLVAYLMSLQRSH